VGWVVKEGGLTGALISFKIAIALPLVAAFLTGSALLSERANAQVLNRLFLDPSNETPLNEVLSFDSETAVANFYGANSSEASLAFEFYADYDGSLANMLFAVFYWPSQASVTSEKIKESYGKLTVGSVNSGTVAVGQQVTGAAPLDITYNHITGPTKKSGSFWIEQQGNFTYASSSLTYAAPGTAARTLGPTQAIGAYLSSSGEDVTSPSEWMNNIVQENGQFSSFQTTFAPDPGTVDSLEAWAQSTVGRRERRRQRRPSLRHGRCCSSVSRV